MFDRSGRPRALRVLAVVAAGTALLSACHPSPSRPGASLPGASSPTTTTTAPASSTTTTAPTETSAPATSTTTTAPVTTSASATPTTTSGVPTKPVPVPVPPSPGDAACAGFPTPACTGVPAGKALTTRTGDVTITTPGATVDGVHVTGALLIRASGVTIRNSQIDGIVTNQFDGEPFYPFTISDSTIGSPTTCDSTASALGDGAFTADHVLIRGFGDGIRASAPDITIRNSYIKLCSTDADSHSDGIQDYVKSANLVFDHNTVDQCGAVPANGKCGFGGGYTAPIFVNSKTDGGTNGAQITNNLVMGGVYSIFIQPQPGRPWVVTGNRVVDGTWTYAAAETNGACKEIDQWSDNSIVRIDSAYRVVATVGPLPCPA